MLPLYTHPVIQLVFYDKKNLSLSWDSILFRTSFMIANFYQPEARTWRGGGISVYNIQTFLSYFGEAHIEAMTGKIYALEGQLDLNLVWCGGRIILM